MERALDAVADHFAAVADVSAEVFAVRFQDVQFTALIPISHQILAEVVERPRLANREFGRPADHEPPGYLPGEGHFHAGTSVCPILSPLQYRFQQFGQFGARELFDVLRRLKSVDSNPVAARQQEDRVEVHGSQTG